MSDLPSNQVHFFGNAEEIAAEIPDGAFLGLPPDYSMPAMAVVHALIRRNAKNLRLLGVPVLGLSADLLIGAGCVAEVESSAVSLGEAGLAPRFTEAVEKNLLKSKRRHLSGDPHWVAGRRERRAVHALEGSVGFRSRLN